MKARRRPLAGRVIENSLCGDTRKRGSGVHSQRLPGLQSIFELLGKDLRIAGCFEDLLRNLAGDLVLPVAVGNSANKRCQNYLWPDLPHRQHRIVKHAVMSPLLESFLLSF